MYKKNVLASLILGVGLIIGAKLCAAEEITLTTYYPSPSGIYKNLTTTEDTYLATDSGRVGIGTADPTKTLDVNGTMRLRNHLYDVTNSRGSSGEVLTRGASGPTWDSSPAGITCRHFKSSHHVVIGGEAYSYAWCQPDEVRTGGGCSVGKATEYLQKSIPVWSSGANKGGWMCKLRKKDWSVSAWVVCCK